MNWVYLLAVLGTFVFLQADLNQAAEIGDGLVKKPDEETVVDVRNKLESGNFKDDKELIDVFKKLEPGVNVYITPLEKDGLERILDVALGCGHVAGKSRQKRLASGGGCSADCTYGSCSCSGGGCSCSCSGGTPACNTSTGMAP